MAYLILDIETIPLPPIDDEVELVIAKKVNTSSDLNKSVKPLQKKPKYLI